MEQDLELINEYKNFILNKEFPCVAAKAALGRDQIKCYVAHNLMCPVNDAEILQFLYSFIDTYRSSNELYHSAAIIFKGPNDITEDVFEEILWQRLQSLSNMDALQYTYDHRVSSDPLSNDFSFSLKGEAFFIIGMHPSSNRHARQFKYPTLVFNPHAQFEKLKETTKYNNLQQVVRKRDIAFSGDVNPMLTDFGNASEVYQYTGKAYSNEWQCPLKINHGKHNSAA